VNIVRKLDGKFGISIDWESHRCTVVNLVSGEEIPEDEPLFLLRARDHNAIYGINGYLGACVRDGCNDLHMAGGKQARQRFVDFANVYPERMKQPGITKHFRLEEGIEITADESPLQVIYRWDVTPSRQYPGMFELRGISGELRHFYMAATPCGRICLREVAGLAGGKEK